MNTDKAKKLLGAITDSAITGGKEAGAMLVADKIIVAAVRKHLGDRWPGELDSNPMLRPMAPLFCLIMVYTGGLAVEGLPYRNRVMELSQHGMTAAFCTLFSTSSEFLVDIYRDIGEQLPIEGEG